ncbi:hypothetical protein C0V82_06505 [Niveispirillum cyanobacteriorum]|uniref:Uncharacterized protein n=1 Tax=Niveispirillum cyanobacteriorum TaxID=1612173 RepID=A0A2K9NBL6_9PROT|nr:hypothetical protein C0V82_06505 [Niveispirillum cyanobacteriorum]
MKPSRRNRHQYIAAQTVIKYLKVILRTNLQHGIDYFIYWPITVTGHNITHNHNRMQNIVMEPTPDYLHLPLQPKIVLVMGIRDIIRLVVAQLNSH